MLTKVTSKDFEGLANPYTGDPMVVYMLTGSGPVKFTCPDTFSTSDTADTVSALYDKWNRVNGVSGTRAGAIRCAYTGELLSLGKRFGKPCYSGGFDPHRFYSREAFLYYAWMRNGVSKYPPPPENTARVKSPANEGEVTERQKEYADRSAPSLDEDKVHMVEKSLTPFKDRLEGSSTVSMHVGKTKGTRRGR